MNAKQLAATVGNAINEAIHSNEVAPPQVIQILECFKLDIYMTMREIETKQPRIFHASELPKA